METRAPDLARIGAAVGFTLSCFGLLLFLWVAFGGPVPFKAQSYRFTAYFPEATQLAVESDVRISGVSVGKVKEISLAPPELRLNGKDLTETVIEIDSEFAPIPSDARAMLRQKTLLGETYVDIAPGSEAGAGDVPDGGTLGIGRVEEATQVDEILNAVDRPTRQAGKRWLAASAEALRGRALDLSDSLANVGPFIEDASTITSIVRRQRDEVARLIRSSGTVLAAISRDEADLAGAITGTEATLGGLADANESLAETIRILPTFENEARLTLARLDRLRAAARPVITELLPVADDISPTLASVRRLAPPLRRVLADTDPLLDAARRGLPATRSFLAELRPALDVLDPTLAHVGPVIRYLYAFRNHVVGFFGGPPLGTAGALPEIPGQPAPRHLLRILPYTSQETLSIYPARLRTNRGNAYIQPFGYLEHPGDLAFENFDCKNTDYLPESQDPDDEERRRGDGKSPPVGVSYAACIRADSFPGDFGGERGPRVERDR